VEREGVYQRMSWTPPEVVASYPKVSAELQAQRDQQANDLRREYEPGSPTVQEEQRIFAQADALKGKIPPKVKQQLHMTTGSRRKINVNDSGRCVTRVSKSSHVGREVRRLNRSKGTSC